ncbi:sphingoid long-chain bases kinase 2, mitochondrial [Dorcoceras hygrometricum]|uniref:Sphingoid long-chain bases kinase 2, mitochondrial n=1 Tax=Dorcoceras hygrometricum TaxID=472368 RepID=A0A2Z7CJZ2_9LAMI|nr:sphingoid long-chain bases kinase 2, mitochondrial [Dorcoceras hygrometricum]
MSLFDLQDVCIAIGSLATLDLPVVVDLIEIYVFKGPYCTLTTTNWFLQALSVIPRGSWRDVARRFTMIRWANRSDQIVDRSFDEVTLIGMNRMFIRWTGPAPDLGWPPPPPLKPRVAAAVRRPLRDRTCFDPRNECRFPRETDRSQAPRHQQEVGSGSATTFPIDRMVKICLQLVHQSLVLKCLRLDHCSLRLDYPTTDEQNTVATCWLLHRKIHRLNLSAKAKQGRIHLSKRHRFAIANFKYYRLVVLYLTTDCDDITADVINTDPSTDSADITAADSSCCLLILLTSSSP